MVMTALVAGGAGGFTHGASDLKASSRANFQRGLAASAALHILLLSILLHATGGGEAVVRTYLTPTDLFFDPIRPVPPPTISPPVSVPSERAPSEVGTFDPREMRPELPVTPFQAGTPSRPADPGETGPSADHTGPAPGPDAGDPNDVVFTVVDEAPVPIFKPTPEYPSWAREAGVSGQVLLNVLVGKDGRVRRVIIEKNVNGLGDAAREALARWTFRPARMNGAAVSTWVAIPVRFEL